MLQDFESYSEQPMTFGTINDLQPILSAEIARARTAGAPAPYLGNLESLRRELNKATETLPEAKAAVENYQRNYAPVWGRGAGEAYRFRTDFNADRMNRTASPPSATAGRFLSPGEGAKENAAALSHIVQSIPDPSDKTAALSTIRRYVLADLTKTIGPDKRISETSLARWLNGPPGWGAALSNFPELKAEVDTLLSDVRAGNVQRNAMATDLERAAANMKLTERQVGNSALALTLGKEPTKAARAVLDSGDPKMAMREVVSEIGQNTAVRKAWERAVTDHLIDRVSTVNPGAVSEGSVAPDYAKLTKAFSQYEDALAELYAGQPEKMDALRRAQRMLEPLAVTELRLPEGQK